MRIDHRVFRRINALHLVAQSKLIAVIPVRLAQKYAFALNLTMKNSNLSDNRGLSNAALNNIAPGSLFDHLLWCNSRSHFGF
jgi:hypothetical protein